MTCIGCGAMGRQERCDGACSEHRLVLVRSTDFDALRSAAHDARARVQRMGELLGGLAAAEPRPQDPDAAFLQLRDGARRLLAELGRAGPDADWADPMTVTGWWCAECGNVDLPQPCLGVCIWKPTDWVNVELYRSQLAVAVPWLRQADTMTRLLAHIAVLRPHAGLAQATWAALRERARASEVPLQRPRLD
jgi:hypothetical protein